MTATALIELVRARLAVLAPVHLEIHDDSARHVGHPGSTGGGHLSATIVSKHFCGLARLDRHRKVYALVNDLMPDRLHALKLSTLTPEEYRLQDKT